MMVQMFIHDLTKELHRDRHFPKFQPTVSPSISRHSTTFYDLCHHTYLIPISSVTISRALIPFPSILRILSHFPPTTGIIIISAAYTHRCTRRIPWACEFWGPQMNERSLRALERIRLTQSNKTGRKNK